MNWDDFRLRSDAYAERCVNDWMDEAPDDDLEAWKEDDYVQDY